MFFELALLGCILQIAQAACTDTTASGRCKQNMCNVQIGGETYCSQCNAESDRIIDGVCTDTDSSNVCTAHSSGACTSCKAGYFLHKGGCYDKTKSPGNKICADKQASDTTGTCKACAEGYFTVSGATATVDSCVACGDDNCATCTVGAEQQKCSKCKATGEKLYLKKEGSGTGTCVTADECTAAGSYVPDSASGPKECKACDSTCKTCSGAASQCTSCKTDKPYLKKDSPTNPAGTCVAADGCGDGSYADTSSKECKACHGDCATCVGAKNVDCTKCKAGNSKDYLKVLDAENGSGQCVATEEECKSNGTYFLVTDTATSTKTCYPCEASSRGGVTNCLTCTASGTAATATCTACRDGYTLDSQANTCASSSANKTGLSTGAIAGISVAAVVVVGGLVGFLCWWFICRGKA